MKFKKIMIICLLAVLTIGAVSASDDVATDVAGDADEPLIDSAAQDDDLSVDDSDSKIGDGVTNWDVLFNITRDAKEGDIIQLSGVYVVDGGGIRAGKSITYNGNGAIIDANGNPEVFSGESALVVKNITFKNCHYVPTHMGTVLGLSDDDVTIIDCNFVNCDFAAVGSNLFISNCSFENCYNVIRTDNLNIDGSTFKNCSGDFAGAIHLMSEGYASIVGCSFKDCYCDHNGGAISFNHKSNGSVVGCSFENCYSKEEGGAIDFEFFSNVSVVDSIFKDCSAKELGGAINQVGGNLTISNSSFIHCFAYGGGAIYFIGSDLNVSNSSFANCIADSAGGAIGSDECGNFIGCSFLNCSANNGGAINTPINVIDCSFIACSASNLGGGIIFWSNTSKMFDCYFKDNTAVNGSDWYSPYDIENVITKIQTSIKASKVTATYGVLKNLVITLRDADGNALESKNVTVVVGTLLKTLPTNAKGQVSVDISKLVPKTSYIANISFAGEGKYIQSSQSAKVTVKKATPKITAAKKTSFKSKTKTKKVKMVLKANGKAVKGAKVTIKVNKKTYTAKTKSNGKATFKITKLTKKGNYKATISYKGNSYYTAKSAKVAIVVK